MVRLADQSDADELNNSSSSSLLVRTSSTINLDNVNCGRTNLFTRLQRQDWPAIEHFFDTNGYWPGKLLTDSLSPIDQARTWVTWVDHHQTGDVDGNVQVVARSILPLHLAVMNDAPLAIVHHLVKLYPLSLRSTGSHNMLPLHIALRYEKSKEVIEFLFRAFPPALSATDDLAVSPIDYVLRADEEHRARTFNILIEMATNRDTKASIAKTWYKMERLRSMIQEQEPVEVDSSSVGFEVSPEMNTLVLKLSRCEQHLRKVLERMATGKGTCINSDTCSNQEASSSPLQQESKNYHAEYQRSSVVMSFSPDVTVPILRSQESDPKSSSDENQVAPQHFVPRTRPESVASCSTTISAKSARRATLLMSNLLKQARYTRRFKKRSPKQNEVIAKKNNRESVKSSTPTKENVPIHNSLTKEPHGSSFSEGFSANRINRLFSQVDLNEYEYNAIVKKRKPVTEAKSCVSGTSTNPQQWSKRSITSKTSEDTYAAAAVIANRILAQEKELLQAERSRTVPRNNVPECIDSEDLLSQVVAPPSESNLETTPKSALIVQPKNASVSSNRVPTEDVKAEQISNRVPTEGIKIELDRKQEPNLTTSSASCEQLPSDDCEHSSLVSSHLHLSSQDGKYHDSNYDDDDDDDAHSRTLSGFSSASSVVSGNSSVSTLSHVDFEGRLDTSMMCTQGAIGLMTGGFSYLFSNQYLEGEDEEDEVSDKDDGDDEASTLFAPPVPPCSSLGGKDMTVDDTIPSGHTSQCSSSVYSGRDGTTSAASSLRR